jgi:hypothetical protein
VIKAAAVLRSASATSIGPAEPTRGTSRAVAALSGTMRWGVGYFSAVRWMQSRRHTAGRIGGPSGRNYSEDNGYEETLNDLSAFIHAGHLLRRTANFEGAAEMAKAAQKGPQTGTHAPPWRPRGQVERLQGLPGAWQRARADLRQSTG